MKFKLYILACSLSLTGVSARAQHFVIGAGVSYNMPLAGSNYDRENITNATAYTYSNTEKAGVYSLGQGVDLHLNLGYDLNDHIRACLVIGYTTMPAITMKSTNTDVVNPFFESSMVSDIHKLSSRSTTFSPQIIAVHYNGKVEFNAYFGPLVGITSEKDFDDNAYTSISVGVSTSQTSHWETKTSGGVTSGFTGGIGIVYYPSEKFGIGLYYHATAAAYKPKKTVTTVYTENGVDQLSTLDYKELDYSNNITYNSIGSSPTQQLTPRIPFSNTGVSVELIVKL